MTVTSGAAPYNPTLDEPVSHAADVFIFPAAPIAADVANATLTVGNFPGLSVSGVVSATLNSK